jgi:integrase
VVQYLEKHWRPLRERPLDSIKRADIAMRLQDLVKAHGRAAAARARTHLSALFVWAMGEGLCDANPVTGTNNPNSDAKPRTRVLKDAEIKAVWQTCIPDDDFSRIVQLLLLTGCRRDEIGALEWSEVDLDAGTITFPERRTKNGRQLALTLPAPALDILHSIPRRADRPYVFGKVGKGFTGVSHAMARFQARMAAAGNALEHWSLHDLRRSAATGMAEIGIQPHVVEAILNHVSGHKAGVAGVYNRAGYKRDIAMALAQWAEHLIAAVEGRTAKVVPFRSGA